MKRILLTLLFALALACPSFAQDSDALTPIEAAIQEGELPAELAMPANITATPEFQAVQSQVMGSPEMINDISKLLEDPEIMSLLSNPDFLTAIQSGNIMALQSDPNLQQLSENPKIRALIEKIKTQQ